jgi:hypothetical protein
VHKLALAHHETHKAAGTQVGTAADQLSAMRDSADHASFPAGQIGPQGAAGNLPPGVMAPPAQAPGAVPPLPAAGPAPGGGLPGAPAPGGVAAPPAGPAPAGAVPAGPPGFMAPGPPADMLAAARSASRPQPGGPPMQAPDGHWYIHAPHAHGTYQRVVPR